MDIKYYKIGNRYYFEYLGYEDEIVLTVDRVSGLTEVDYICEENQKIPTDIQLQIASDIDKILKAEDILRRWK